MIDPGPDEENHIRALSFAVESAEEVRILLTHRHSDHSGGAVRLAQLVGAPLLGPPSCRPPEGTPVSFQLLEGGSEVPTDNGMVKAVEIPGHTKDHLGFYWEAARALFVGDLLLGKGETTWVGEYLGSVEDYLNSLAKVEAMNPEVLYPGHGPPAVDAASRVRLFRRHRLERLQEVRSIRSDNPEADAGELAAIIYKGEIPEKLLKAAVASVEAALFHLDRETERPG